jgi:hypothetical protein
VIQADVGYLRHEIEVFVWKPKCHLADMDVDGKFIIKMDFEDRVSPSMESFPKNCKFRSNRGQ